MMRQPSTSACGRFPKVCRTMSHPVEHAACVTTNGVSIQVLLNQAMQLTAGSLAINFLG